MTHFAVLIPARDVWRYKSPDIYIPEIYSHRVKRGKHLRRAAYQHRSVFGGVDAVIGYIEPCNVKTAHSLGLNVISVDGWHVPIKTAHVDHARQVEAESAIDPFVAKSFNRGDVVQSQDWLLDGRKFRVKKSNNKITHCNDIDTGHRLQLQTNKLFLSPPN